jgi:hypothetical protein
MSGRSGVRQIDRIEGLTMVAGGQRGDWVHFALMVAALGLAYAMPFELLILARAVLGPAHYTTEISWLHDRGYFLKRRSVAAVLAIVAVGVSLANYAPWSGFIIWAAFVVSAAAAATRSSRQTGLLRIAAGAHTTIMFVKSPALAVTGALLTTVVHASLFTLVFMGLGAWRTQSRVQAALIGAYIAAIALLVVFPPSEATAVVPVFADLTHRYFVSLGQPLGALFGIGDLSIDRVAGLFAFIYAYHYLNWFIKAEVIRWANIPPRRWVTIGVVYAASTGLYFYDFALGFSVVMALSFMHVILEFPLDALAVRQLGEVIAGSLFGGLRERRV